MINFQKVKYENFLATGAAGNEITLNTHPSTLISAKNGSGKSTILDAIIFGLFGKPFRDVNRNQLINSINGKAMLVTLWFSIDNNQFEIRRGIKPNIFEIYQNGELISQEAAIRDYQKFLEQQILKTNLKAFTQSAILGTANFVPFMKMRPHERREVIEDFLDVKVFGVMNQILKGDISLTKSRLNIVDNELAVSKSRVASQKGLITRLQDINVQAIDVISSKIAVNSETIRSFEEDIVEIQTKIDRCLYQAGGLIKARDDLSDIRIKKSKIDYRLSDNKKTVGFLEANSECPSCAQDINDTHREPLVSELEKENETLHFDLMEIRGDIEKYTLFINKAEAHVDEADKLKNEISGIKQQISSIKTLNLEYQDEITSMASSDILDEKMKLRDLANEVLAKLDERVILSDSRSLQDVAYEILKDSGVKTTIIKEYLPIINEMINQYLNIMDFYVDFNLDESFSEIVRSRCRDEFTYASFSEGEKKRLDIAILFTWRKIAKMKNSVNCNILFLDEILDGSVDETGLESIFDIIEEEAKTSNVFVISHNEKFKSKFENTVSIIKQGDFSVVDYSERS